MKHRFVGFGFGPIQAGLCVAEAFAGGCFDRLTIAEVDGEVVRAVRENRGRYTVNIAHSDRVETRTIEGVRIFNPIVAEDRVSLVNALSEATEIFTCLPSVDTYTAGGQNSVAALLAEGLQSSLAPATLIYTAENHNHAAEILQSKVQSFNNVTGRPVQYLNTVIGKMSQVITNPDEIGRLNLRPITPAISRAFLVEAFNRILATRATLPDIQPGIRVFGEKDDLLPFEEAKLYGHNAIHALLAYLGLLRGCVTMTELKAYPEIMAIARRAFLDESGAALIKKYAHLGDPLFTPEGYRAFADDLLERMTNPFLHDAVTRAARDPLRKLGWDDRLIGTMRLALEYNIEPTNMAVGALAACQYLLHQSENFKPTFPIHLSGDSAPHKTAVEEMLRKVWPNTNHNLQKRLIDLICSAKIKLAKILP
ncbi:MAG: hypothetical protein JW709_11810 [Sedimentisphaerales bacterium]|nr:hypothetical protein [Sedimentisphaerales bacterium]